MPSRNRLQQRDWMKQLQQTYNSMISAIRIHIADISLITQKAHKQLLFFLFTHLYCFMLMGAAGLILVEVILG